MRSCIYQAAQAFFLLPATTRYGALWAEQTLSLDGEAAQEGGMGIARQLKDEVFNCPPVLVITGRKEDAWLAAWSLAEASVVHPIDPFTLAKTAAQLLRGTTLVPA